ncbi:MAG: ribonuclease III, partial [Gammaproteobacteria bacterium]
NKDKPIYRQMDISGPDHDKQFEVSCSVGEKTTTAIASSKKKAEQAAADAMLQLLNL